MVSHECRSSICLLRSWWLVSKSPSRFQEPPYICLASRIATSCRVCDKFQRKIDHRSHENIADLGRDWFIYRLHHPSEVFWNCISWYCWQLIDSTSFRKNPSRCYQSLTIQSSPVSHRSSVFHRYHQCLEWWVASDLPHFINNSLSPRSVDHMPSQTVYSFWETTPSFPRDLHGAIDWCDLSSPAPCYFSLALPSLQPVDLQVAIKAIHRPFTSGMWNCSHEVVPTSTSAFLFWIHVILIRLR